MKLESPTPKVKVRPLCEVWDGCGPFGNVGVLVGGMLGAKAGADVSKWAYTKIFGTWAVPNVEDALETCYNMLGVTTQHTWRDVLSAYRKLAKSAHPDQGGSNEEMVKLNVCKEMIFQARDKPKRGGNTTE